MFVNPTLRYQTVFFLNCGIGKKHEVKNPVYNPDFHLFTQKFEPYRTEPIPRNMGVRIAY